MRAHLRSEIHGYARQGYLPRGGTGELTIKNIGQRIKDAKRKLPD